MEQESRKKTHSVIKELQERPCEFDFFQALRRYEFEYRDLPRIGESIRPSEDPVRFGQNVSFGFPASAIASYESQTEQGPAKMLVNFLGLLGSNGPLPLGMTEYVHTRLHQHGDSTLASFLDIFNHRMISLFYRAWANCNQCVSYDRQNDDYFASYVGSLVGTDNTSQAECTEWDYAKLHWSGRLLSGSRNAEGLKAILEGVFDVDIEIEEFCGTWIHIPQEDICCLGGNGENAQLGKSSIMGTRFWECQRKFHIRLGPVDYDNYRSFYPESPRLRHLMDWVTLYVGQEFDYDLQLVLKSSEVPPPNLDKTVQLGRSCWVHSNPLPDDASDLRIGTGSLA